MPSLTISPNIPSIAKLLTPCIFSCRTSVCVCLIPTTIISTSASVPALDPWSKAQQPCPSCLCISSSLCTSLHYAELNKTGYLIEGEWGAESWQQWFAFLMGWSIQSSHRTTHTQQAPKLMFIWPRTLQNMEVFVLWARDYLSPSLHESLYGRKKKSCIQISQRLLVCPIFLILLPMMA